MSEEIANVSKIEINDQEIQVETRTTKDFRVVVYGLTSQEPIEPVTVALTLYLICKDICSNCNIEIDQLEDGLVESDDMH
jgi:hypothetical protein